MNFVVKMSKKTTTIQTGHDYGRAMLDNSTFNKEARTIEVVFATETPVKRWSWSIDGVFNEILDISKAAMNAERLDTGGAPVLNSHSRWDLSSQIGVIERAWIDESKKEARALLRLSSREDIQGIIKDIEDGIIRNISVGYSVQEYLVDKDKTPHEYRATKWTPSEISFVPVPADHNSGTRSKENSNITTTIISNSNNNMEEQNQEQERAPETKPAAPNPAPATTPVVDEAAIRKQAVDAERKRVADINALCDNIKLPNDAEFRSQLITDGISIEKARERAIDEVAKNANKPPVTVSVGEEKQSFRAAMEIGLAHRSMPGKIAEIKDNPKALEYSNYRMLDFAKECLRNSGERPEVYGEPEIVKRAFATTDFPALLTNTFARTLNRYYGGHVPEWQRFARRESVSDFRSKTALNIDGAVTFEEITEGGEYKSSDLLYDESNTIGVKKFGRKYAITEKAIINDDLSVFSKLPQYMAIGAQRYQSEKVWGLITGNAKAGDGKAIFHTDHGNLAATGAAISDAALTAARIAMRKQAAPKSKLRLGIVPAFLVVPAELENIAKKAVSAVLATTTGEVNIHAGTLEVIVSDALTNPTEWYIVADPEQTIVDGLVYSYLNGHEGLQLDSRINFDTDSLEIKGKLYFDAAVWGWQSWYKNPGA